MIEEEENEESTTAEQRLINDARERVSSELDRLWDLHTLRLGNLSDYPDDIMPREKAIDGLAAVSTINDVLRMAADNVGGVASLRIIVLELLKHMERDEEESAPRSSELS